MSALSGTVLSGRALSGRVAIVTGASRGIGKGCALELGAAGATVYVTGRTLEEGAAPLPGTIGSTAEEVTRLGGQGIAVRCDHRDDVDRRRALAFPAQLFPRSAMDSELPKQAERYIDKALKFPFHHPMSVKDRQELRQILIVAKHYLRMERDPEYRELQKDPEDPFF